MSFLGKKWVIKNHRSDLGLIDKMLENRNLRTEDERFSFFNYSLKKLHDPFLLKDMEKGVSRLKEAIAKKEKIMIFGDYDVDGTSATALIYDFLKKVDANVHYTLPDRENDGYGLKDYFIRRFAEEGVKVIVTVDCGTANVNEIGLANELGMDTVVTDHHDCPAVLPEAYALINPKRPDGTYPNRELSGSAVAYKLVCAMAPFYFEEQEAEQYLYAQMGLAVLGLIADCMSLTGENRVLTNNGLKSLSEGHHPGIKALLEEAGMDTGKVTAITVGYFIGPRINAAGRLDTAEHALELLLGDTEKVETLSQLNSRRQQLVEGFVEQAIAQVEAMEELPCIIVVSSRDWNAGTLGLIAGRMMDRFSRPTIAMQEKDDEFVASCRSLNDFDITAYLRKEAGELFTNVGGHMLAGGFTLPRANKDELIQRMKGTARQYIDPENFYGLLELECIIDPLELSFDLSNKITKFEPFGMGNPEPTLLLKKARIDSIKRVGKEGQHLQFPVKLGDQKFAAIAFRFAQHLDKISPDKHYDVAFNLEINEWQGYRKLQLKVVDLKESGE
ncbi:MAG: single-stranded-DNA-specific exonuclease RecJ [Candidatus Peregrinibacteria bacterium]|nr:single-stranded-DNA-specific exonuclease RecJ [Candidatus Peregrinibacteria bacterium]